MAEAKITVTLKPDATGAVTVADGPFRKTFQPGVSAEVTALEYERFIRPTGRFIVAPKTRNKKIEGNENQLKEE